MCIITFRYLMIVTCMTKICSTQERTASVWKNEKFDTFNLTRWEIHMTELVTDLRCLILCLANHDCYGIQFDHQMKICQQLSFKCAETTHVLATNDVIFNSAVTSDVSFNYLLRGETCPKQKGYTFFEELCLCVKFYPDPLLQGDANATCYGDGGELVRIDNAVKQEGVWMYVSTLNIIDRRVTIQGKRNNGQWLYDDSTLFHYVNWNIHDGQPSGDPDEYYLYMKIDAQGMWNDVREKSMPFICEIQLLH